MEIKYFKDTDTLLINFNENLVNETKEINENLLIDFDEKGNIVSMTIEHAKNTANVFDLNYQQLPASV